MINKMGCYIRNDFYFLKDKATADNIFNKSSEIDCAESCHKDPKCTFGWRYQLASKLCIFMQNVNITDLKPEMPVLKDARTLGWASGLKACSEPALDGGWGSWKSNTIGDCTVKTRACDNPVKCGAGSSCRGPSVEKIGCKDEIPGNWGLWSGWSSCSVSCGGGVQIRKRLCNNPEPEHGGADCKGPETSAKNCNRFECPIDGGWSAWSAWKCSCNRSGWLNLISTCSIDRTRTCTNPAPAYNGDYCSGYSNDIHWRKFKGFVSVAEKQCNDFLVELTST